jgi:hypothetical protein
MPRGSTSQLRVLLHVCIVVSTCLTLAKASVGDRSSVHEDCVGNCTHDVCLRFTAQAYSQEQQSWPYRLLQWSCYDDCQYNCMWKTVDDFSERGQPCPQFRGKWPFIRFAGMQEPASVLFSILNIVPHAVGLVKLRATVAQSSHMYYAWQCHFVIAINAFVWSAAFHSRDTDFTERMDYFCAALLVIASVNMVVVRMFGSRDKVKVASIMLALAALYIHHVLYMTFVLFDYGYNMKVMVTVGMVNSALWLSWCYWHRAEMPYVWKAVAALIGGNLLVTFEIFDFAPVWWMVDAHALWHAGTVPLSLLWTSFVFDDFAYINRKKQT